MDCPLCESGHVRPEKFVLHGLGDSAPLFWVIVKADVCDTCREVFLLPGQYEAMRVLRGEREFPGIPQGKPTPLVIYPKE